MNAQSTAPGASEKIQPVTNRGPLARGVRARVGFATGIFP